MVIQVKARQFKVKQGNSLLFEVTQGNSIKFIYSTDGNVRHFKPVKIKSI